MNLDEKKLKNIAKKLRISVLDYALLKQAFTHRSYLGEDSEAQSNERLEFLGDSVIGVVISEYLYTTFPDRPEGDLAKAKAVAVSEPVLAEAASDLGLSDFILMSSGEETTGGRERFSILSDTFEALVAVIFFDTGLDGARDFILKALKQILIDVENREHIRDYKTLLQEYTQGTCKKAPKYIVIREHGADHDKIFTIEARLDDKILGKGNGKNKKQAEQAAALEAIETLGLNHTTSS